MILDRYLVKQFLPIFAVAVSMFVMLLLLIDLFSNLVSYLNYEAPLKQILLVTLFYVPKTISYALPISLLFASAYTLGDLYAKNELTSIFSSGIPFWRFSVSLVLIGLLASLFAFVFDDTVVIPTLKQKNDLGNMLLHKQRTENNSDIVIKANNGRRIYSVDFFDVKTTSLNGVNIIEQDDGGDFLALIRSPRATWNGDHWVFSNAVIYQWESGILRALSLTDAENYTEHPDIFGRNAVDVESLSARQAGLLVEDLRNAGLPFISAQADYYHRFSFPTASLVVMILSISMGGRFKKNILLMSLLASLGGAVIFYVSEMVTMMMARLGYIPAIMGAWFPVLLFITIGLLLLRGAKT
ncbi:membrane protein [Spirochaetia bacterium]|nr:membrane protein [Spirochaetia bacterium]